MNINDYKDTNGNVEVSETLVGDIIDGINTNEANNAVEAWTNLPMVNGWTMLSGQYARYYQKDKRVYVEGYITNSTYPANSHFATMPTNLRPSVYTYIPSATNGSSVNTSYITVTTVGVVSFAGSTVSENRFFQFSYRIA